MIIIPKLRIGYQDIPKVASTSFFRWIYTCLYKKKYDPFHNGANQPIWVHDYFGLGKCADAIPIKNENSRLGDFNDFFFFTLTRDPVKRFLSMYANRVLQHGELSARSPVAHKLARAGLCADPNINLLITELSNYMHCQASIYHHARPMIDFIGPDLSVYGRIADIAKTDSVIDDIKAHWSRHGLVVALRSAGEIGWQQSNHLKLGLEVLAPESFEKLLEYYHDDYEKIPTVSLKKIKHEYKNVTPTSSYGFRVNKTLSSNSKGNSANNNLV